MPLRLLHPKRFTSTLGPIRVPTWLTPPPPPLKHMQFLPNSIFCRHQELCRARKDKRSLRHVGTKAPCLLHELQRLGILLPWAQDLVLPLQIQNAHHKHPQPGFADAAKSYRLGATNRHRCSAAGGAARQSRKGGASLVHNPTATAPVSARGNPEHLHSQILAIRVRTPPSPTKLYDTSRVFLPTPLDAHR